HIDVRNLLFKLGRLTISTIYRKNGHRLCNISSITALFVLYDSQFQSRMHNRYFRKRCKGEQQERPYQGFWVMYI
ncbi:MAG: hypothetical protein SAK29_28855, partial [Scytonema sp. PMC 1069.18]|nr:hypothetical protein [Scytonema sp. PMC 1069.18]